MARERGVTVEVTETPNEQTSYPRAFLSEASPSVRLQATDNEKETMAQTDYQQHASK